MEKKMINTGIYRLSNEMDNIRYELIENGGEINDDILARLDNAQAEQVALVDDIFNLIKCTENENAAIDDEIKRLQNLKKSRKNAVDSVKKYLLQFMINNGVDKIDGALVSAKIRKGVESVEVDEEMELRNYEQAINDFQSTLPAFVKIKPSINKTELKKWIQEGGASLTGTIVKNPSLKLG